MLTGPVLALEGRLSAIEIADLLLLILIRRSASALLLEPIGNAHVLTLEQGAESTPALKIPAALGDAVVARLAIVAGLDIAAPEEQMGRVRLRLTKPPIPGVDASATEVLFVVEASPRGLEIELRRFAGAQDATAVAAPAKPGSVDGAASSFPLVPSRQKEPYRILGEIGRGAMGIVYRGEHTTLGKPVAIKVLNLHMTANPQLNLRFQREGRAASRARHPGIIDVTDFGTLEDGRAFLVMELVEGRTLQSIIDDGAMPPPRAVNIATQVAAALDAALAVGVVHRDIKPSNIFVAQNDAVKIGDFGAAKLQGAAPSGAPSDTQAGRLVGTPHYMSPEHARCESTDRRTDIYSLGCVLFAMISGRVPYDAAGIVEVLSKHLVQPVPQVESPFGPLPVIVQSIVNRAMAKRVSERYQTAGEMRGDLERAAVALSRTDWRRWLPV
jgi:serine/threonine-protein kinase